MQTLWGSPQLNLPDASGMGHWDRGDLTRALLNVPEALEILLLLAGGMGSNPPQPGYPPTGDQLNGMPPIVADATIRRAQRFVCMPSEPIRWSYGGTQGEVLAGDDGAVTIPALPISHTATTLVLERVTQP